ncbi:hypothetical protein DYBT9275_02846 [Dyadobacter sp. CECT 9275]|uniref:Cytochrome c domain-containing protein n=1 Tax=Dyadobacter helix TaxID=2822344 RepID=A0A916JEY7_9BACT|nr:VCBS repeat-containing protein [Dyadobacter sp. CECT 9275]CAG5002236.1 hypothetical protein DYBT9275_02846 [Dyadobacter sp. CECT 9275]
MLIFRAGAAIFFCVWVTSLSVKQGNEESLPVSHTELSLQADSTMDGKKLAMQYCAGCHLFPAPDLLDKKTWVGRVLPNMALRLGVRKPGEDPYVGQPAGEEKLMRELNVYPETAMLSEEAWEKIVAYYEKEAPEEPLPQKSIPAVADTLPLFKTAHITIGDKSAPKTTMLKFDPGTSQLYVGDDQQALYVLDSQFQLKDTWWVDTAPVDIDFPKNAPPRLLTIGIFSPSEQKLGRLMSLDRAGKSAATVNIQSLPRPVQFSTGDLNMDGKEDVVIAGFGNNSGKLFWYNGFDPSKENILKALPGARRTEILDINKDKKPDVIALMAQAREQVSIFYNLGNGKFREKVVLQFPPSYGTSYFELADFNKDGFQDILLTNGDNWDYSAIAKNYHGVRIYLNDGRDNFREAWFYPLYGASKAVARDFDNDGDLDIAATSFYSDLNNPQHGFLYLSNEGKMNFKAFSTPMAVSGKWMTMEVADFDKDGDLDIVLGSYFQTIGEMTKLIFQGVTSFPQLMVLTNQKK